MMSCDPLGQHHIKTAQKRCHSGPVLMSLPGIRIKCLFGSMHERHKDGCVSLFSKSIIEALWEQVEKSHVPVRKIAGPQSDLANSRTGWKTVRIFVSSTFKDFHQEREILVKKVWLQKWKHLLVINLK